MIKSSRRDQYIYNKIKELEASVNPEVSWGEINGTLSNQTDLKTALDNKENLLPDKTGKAGKYLKINTGETGYEWADAGGSSHQSSHQSGGSDALTGNLDAIARTTVRKNSGADIGSRRRLNFIEGSNITLTIADDSVNEEVDVTINASSSGGVTIAQRTLTADETKTNDTSMQGWFNNNNRLLLDANSIYEFEGMFSSLNGSTSHGLNMQFDAISGATIRWAAIGAKVNETTQATATRVLSTNTFDTARNVTTASTVTGNVVWVRGIIVTGASGGYFSPKVAQTAASGSFVVKAGTYMKVRKVGANTDTNIGGWTT